MTQDATPPSARFDVQPDVLHVRLDGDWTAPNAPDVERLASEIMAKANEGEARQLRLDLSGVSHLDTMGALVMSKLRHTAGSDGLRLDFAQLSAPQRTLIHEVDRIRAEPVSLERKPSSWQIFVDVGEAVVDFGRDIAKAPAFSARSWLRPGGRSPIPAIFAGLHWCTRSSRSPFAARRSLF